MVREAHKARVRARAPLRQRASCLFQTAFAGSTQIQSLCTMTLSGLIPSTMPRALSWNGPSSLRRISFTALGSPAHRNDRYRFVRHTFDD